MAKRLWQSIEIAVLFLAIIQVGQGFVLGQDEGKIDVERAFELLEDRGGRDFDTPTGKQAAERAIAYVEASGYTAYDFGTFLYERGFEERSIYWYEAVGIATNDPQFYFGRAWFTWRSGDAVAAIRDINFLLNKDIPPLISARTYLLRGRINIESRFFQDAREDLREALKTYESIEGKYGGQYLCLTELARLAVIEKDYDRALPLLDTAIEVEKKNQAVGHKPYGRGFIHEILGVMYFQKGTWTLALEENLKSREAYLKHGNYDSAEAIHVKIGLLNFLTGNPKEAHRIATEIHRSLQGTSKTRLWAYNNVTLAMISLCSGMESDYRIQREAALSWAEPNMGGQDIKDLMTFLEERVPCPELEESDDEQPQKP